MPKSVLRLGSGSGLRVAGGEVVDDPLDQELVGDHDRGAIAGVDVGIGEGDVEEAALDFFKGDPIADLDWLRDRYLYAGDRVGDRVLGSEADDRGEHRGRGEDA